jgi:hypothetical protein
MKTPLLIVSGILAAANVATAQTAPDILGTWQGTYENTDPLNSGYDQVNPTLFVVQSEVGTAISGDFTWLAGNTGRCPTDPCTTTWSGSINSSGQLSLVGQFGDDYSGTLIANVVGNTISGTFNGPNGGNNRGYGTWNVTSAPEISTVSASSALTLLFGGLLVHAGRKRRSASSA